MATKQKFVFVFICCLLLISMAESSRLSRCLSACNKGTKAIQAFCRTVPLPQIRAICWGYQFAGPTACRGFCYCRIGTLTSMVTERLQHTYCIPINSHLHWTNNIKSLQFRNITYQTCTFLVLCNNLRKM